MQKTTMAEIYCIYNRTLPPQTKNRDRNCMKIANVKINFLSFQKCCYFCSRKVIYYKP